MSALHDETRMRWGSLDPEKFIGTVIYGALRDKVKLTWMVVHVYTQIIHSLPATANIRLRHVLPGSPPEMSRLRDVFRQICGAIDDAHDITSGETPTLTLSTYTPQNFILTTVRDVRFALNIVTRWATTVQVDPDAAPVTLTPLEGKRTSDVAADILRHASEITQLLDFAQAYAERQKVAPVVTAGNGIH